MRRSFSWNKPVDSIGRLGTAEHVFCEVSSPVVVDGFAFRPDMGLPSPPDVGVLVLRRRGDDGTPLGIVSQIVVDDHHPLEAFVARHGDGLAHHQLDPGDCLTIEIQKGGDIGVLLPAGLVTVYYRSTGS